jgi:4-amino-4-deoxy-L-arabinose transferase-like glycosyltransferase
MSNAVDVSLLSAIDRVSGSRSRAIIWCVSIFVIWFLALNASHLTRSDEGRYAEISREMFASADWVTVRYNGLKYFEKPPLHMWMTSLAFRAFGVGDWQARLWVGITGMAGILATAFAASRWFGGRVGLFCGLILLATPSWILGGHVNSLDMGLSGALACVLASFLVAQHPHTGPNARRRWMLVAWGSAAAAVLMKGLVGVALPGLVMVMYILIARDWNLWRQLNILGGIPWFLVICAPWFILVTKANPEFPQFFFVHEHWLRYTTSIHKRAGPIWYFLPQMLIGFLPWLGLSRGMAIQVIDEKGGQFRPKLLLALWAGAIFAFFSLSSSKLPGYILPIFPALAILAALALDKLTANEWRKQVRVMLIVCAAGLLVSPLVGRMGGDEESNSFYRNYSLWIGAACAVAFGGLLVAKAFVAGKGDFANKDPAMSIGLASVSIFVALTVALAGHEALARPASGADLVPRIKAVLTDDMPIYSVRLLDHTLPFYLRRTTIMVEAPDELAFGTEQEPSKWLPTLSAFVSAWASGPHALALMSRDTYQELLAKNVDMSVVASDSRRIVVSNFRSGAP